MPPAISTSSETQPIPEISGSSHSSKNTLGRFFRLSARVRASARRASRAPTSSSARSLASTNAPSIRIIPRIPATLRWLNAWTADEIGLEIGKGQDEVRASAQGSRRCLPRWRHSPVFSRGEPEAGARHSRKCRQCVPARRADTVSQNNLTGRDRKKADTLRGMSATQLGWLFRFSSRPCRRHAASRVGSSSRAFRPPSLRS